MDRYSLFRQQVIDEFSSKLNGDVLLTTNASRIVSVSIVCWVFVGILMLNFINIEHPTIVSGNLYYDDQNNLAVEFLLSPEAATEIHPNKIFDAQLLNFSSSKLLFVPVRIAGDTNQLISVNSKKTFVKVQGILQSTSIIVEGREYKLTDGIEVSITLNKTDRSLLSWIFSCFSKGRING